MTNRIKILKDIQRKKSRSISSNKNGIKCFEYTVHFMLSPPPPFLAEIGCRPKWRAKSPPLFSPKYFGLQNHIFPHLSKSPYNRRFSQKNIHGVLSPHPPCFSRNRL